MKNPVLNAEYRSLKGHQANLAHYSLRRLFEDDSQRAERLSCEVGGLYFDYSKNHITPETLSQLCDFARSRKLTTAIQSLFKGERVNNTENRPALHTALRFQGLPSNDAEKLVDASHKKIAECVTNIHSGRWLGFTGKPIDHVIHIGIGGSDLGPRMVVEGLKVFHTPQITVSFVANVDGADLCGALQHANPETTLFIIASKSFSTVETLSNAVSAKRWLMEKGCDETDLPQHFIAISTNIVAAQDFGIAEHNIFPMWDWVGGRYSLWSTIGLPIALALGMEHFTALLAGANEMDQHYRQQAPEKNMPVIAALLTFWYSQFWGTKTHAVLPYAQCLSRLPAYLQQLDMESLGKSVTKDGAPVDYPTGNIIWGAEGTNGQHSFHQLLHQGTELIPVDFIAINKSMSPLKQQHQELLACCISQSQALLKGKTLADAEKELINAGNDGVTAKELAPHKVIKGNKPSNTIIMNELTPYHLGSLIAFYEHKVYTLGVLLDINPFDQWGVELGKQLGEPISQALQGGGINPKWDASTQALIRKCME